MTNKMLNLLPSRSIRIAVFLVIIGMPIFTFGHEAAKKECAHPYSKDACDAADRAMNGFMAALAWPLFWSWELQEEDRK